MTSRPGEEKVRAGRWEGAFRDEIVPVEIRQKKAVLRFEEDEYPRDGVTAEGLAGLKSAFKPGGTVTAGNASGINDGAAAVVVMREETAQRLGARPMARFVTGAIAGCDPAYMGYGSGVRGAQGAGEVRPGRGCHRPSLSSTRPLRPKRWR
jgi:acetyl-CoA C-acetyltransferase